MTVRSYEAAVVKIQKTVLRRHEGSWDQPYAKFVRRAEVDTVKNCAVTLKGCGLELPLDLVESLMEDTWKAHPAS